MHWNVVVGKQYKLEEIISWSGFRYWTHYDCLASDAWNAKACKFLFSTASYTVFLNIKILKNKCGQLVLKCISLTIHNQIMHDMI